MCPNNHFIESIKNTVNLAGDHMPIQPLIEIMGRKRVLIENHNGLVSYSTTLILVKTRCGSIEICGEELQMNHISKSKIVIHGCIHCVRLHEGG